MTMMDGIFSGEAGVAKQLLNLFGVNGSLTIKAGKSYDPSDGSEIITTGKTYNVQVTPPLRYGTKDIDGSNILKTDCYCYFSPVDIENTITTISPDQLNHSKIEINDICFNIVDIKSIYSGEQNAVFKIQLRENNL